MSQEIENEELYVEHEEFGEGLVLSIDEDTDVAEIQFEHGVESIDINDLLEETDEDDDQEELEFEDEELTDDETEELEEGRGKRGSARQASKACDDDDYEAKGNKASKGRFDISRKMKQSRYDESAELLGQALEKKPVDFAATLNDMLQARIQDRIESLKISTAQSMYNSNSSDEGSDEDA